MAAHTLAPADYSPDRDTPKAAVAMLAAVAIFGLWRGFAHEFAAERVSGSDAPAAGADTLRAAAAVPVAAVGVDTMIPPAVEPAPVAPVAPVASSAKPTPLDGVVAGEVASESAANEPDADSGSRPDIDPGLQALEAEPAPPVEDEPPPDDFEPYY